MWYPDNRLVHEWVSYSRIDGEFWIVDHRADTLLRLNATASAVFAKLLAGERPDAGETEFLAGQLSSVVACPDQTPATDPAVPQETMDPFGDFRYLRELASCRCVPLFATLEVTYGCNLDCFHCYRPRDTAETVPLARWKSLLAELKSTGTLNVALTGGEPLVWPYFEEIVGELRRLRIGFLLKTNGWLLDDSTCQFLAANYVTEVHISLYGGTAASHDAVTQRPGSFPRAREAAARCAAAGIPVQISCILTRPAWQEFDAVAQIAEELDVGIGFNPVIMPSAARDLDYGSLRLTPQQLQSFCGATAGATPLSRVLRLPGHPVCSAARSNCSIAPDGKVYPCNGYWYGTDTLSILDRPFTEVWENSPILQRLRRLTNADLTRCSNCEDFAFCPRCPGMGYAESGEWTCIAPGDCLYARAFRTAYEQQPPAVSVAQVGSFGTRCQ